MYTKIIAVPDQRGYPFFRFFLHLKLTSIMKNPEY